MPASTQPDTSDRVPVMVVTGPVGVGKTTVATQVSELLEDLLVETDGRAVAEIAQEILARSRWPHGRSWYY